MTAHDIRIVQVFRVEREIVMAVEAVDCQAAIDQQSEGDAPDFHDQRWKETWALESEDVAAADLGARRG